MVQAWTLKMFVYRNPPLALASPALLASRFLTCTVLISPWKSLSWVIPELIPARLQAHCFRPPAWHYRKGWRCDYLRLGVLGTTQGLRARALRSRRSTEHDGSCSYSQTARRKTHPLPDGFFLPRVTRLRKLRGQSGFPVKFLF